MFNLVEIIKFQYRLSRLKKHLVQLEKEVGQPLRTTPRWSHIAGCPIQRFAPDIDKEGNKYFGPGFHCATYQKFQGPTVEWIHYEDPGSFWDLDWWIFLGRDKQEEVFKKISEWSSKRRKTYDGS